MSNKNRKAQENKRIPMQGQRKNAPLGMEEGFYYRWCADYNKGKLGRYKAAGYEFVMGEDGKRIERPGADAVYLMRLPKKLRDEDLLAKKQKVIKINEAKKRELAPQGGVVPEYIPKGHSDVMTQDER